MDFFVAARNELPEEALSYLAEQLCVGAPDLTGMSSPAARDAALCRYSAPSRFQPNEPREFRGRVGVDIDRALPSRSPAWRHDRQRFSVVPRSEDYRAIAQSHRTACPIRTPEIFGRISGFRDRSAFSETITLLEASLKDPESPTGFHKLKDDAGQATLKICWLSQRGWRLSRNLICHRHCCGFLARLGSTGLCGRSAARRAPRCAGMARSGAGALRRLPDGPRSSARRCCGRSSGRDDPQDRHAFAAQGRGQGRREIEKVYGKERLLAEIAAAAVDDPSGRICDVILPGSKQR